jgi:hypothetical protein
LVRKDIWKASSSSQHYQLMLIINRSKSGIKYAIFNLWGLWVCVGLCGFNFSFGFEGVYKSHWGKTRKLNHFGNRSWYVPCWCFYWINYLFEKNKTKGGIYKKLLRELDEDEKGSDDPLT